MIETINELDFQYFTLEELAEFSNIISDRINQIKSGKIVEKSMVIKPINFANFELVEIKNGTPHCKVHGAMNKLNKLEDGGGYWRCISAVTTKNDTACRAGCVEIRHYEK